MRLHVLQHAPFETPAYILDWARRKSIPVTTTHLYDMTGYPNQMDFDALVILGGPMGAQDDEAYPWMHNEKRFIEKAIVAEKKILGICLGAQLLAHVLGSGVYHNDEKEIGWYPVKLTVEGQSHPLLQGSPVAFNAFHWHGDTFDIPEQGIPIAESEACINQGFVMNNYIIGLQFHLESTADSIRALIEEGHHEIQSGRWIQTEKEILDHTDRHVRKSNQILSSVLDRWMR